VVDLTSPWLTDGGAGCWWPRRRRPARGRGPLPAGPWAARPVRGRRRRPTSRRVGASPATAVRRRSRRLPGRPTRAARRPRCRRQPFPRPPRSSPTPAGPDGPRPGVEDDAVHRPRGAPARLAGAGRPSPGGAFADALPLPGSGPSRPQPAQSWSCRAAHHRAGSGRRARPPACPSRRAEPPEGVGGDHRRGPPNRAAADLAASRKAAPAALQDAAACGRDPWVGGHPPPSPARCCPIAGHLATEPRVGAGRQGVPVRCGSARRSWRGMFPLSVPDPSNDWVWVSGGVYSTTSCSHPGGAALSQPVTACWAPRGGGGPTGARRGGRRGRRLANPRDTCVEAR